MLFRPTDQRILQGSAATLTGLTSDQDGTLAAPSGAVTVEVVSEATGTVKVAAGTATTSTVTGTYTVALTAAQTATLDRLEARWTASGVRVATTRIDIVGGYWASITDIINFDGTLADSGKFPASKLVEARNTAEQLFESVLGRAFTRRYSWGYFEPTCSSTLVLDGPDLRSIRTVREYTDGTTYTSWTVAELASVLQSSAGVATRTDGGTWDDDRILVEWEHGQDRPPLDLRRALLKYIRYLLSSGQSLIPDRATSMVDGGNGATFRLITAGQRGSWTGIPEVDEALARHRWHTVGIA